MSGMMGRGPLRWVVHEWSTPVTDSLAAWAYNLPGCNPIGTRVTGPSPFPDQLERMTLMKKFVVLFGVLIMALSVQAQMSSMAGGVAKSITDMEQQWASASKMSNPDSVAPLLADNFVNMDSDGTMSTKMQTLDRMKSAKWQTNEISDVKVTVHGNTAIASGSWMGKGTAANGTPVDAHEHWVDTWMKMPGGKWQCIASASAPSKM